MTRYCKTCKKEFKPKARNVIMGFGFYCSRSCAAKDRTGKKNSNYREGPIISVCVICGKEYKPANRERKRPNKYCSVECRGIGYRSNKNPNWNGGHRSGRKGYKRDVDMGTKRYRDWKDAVKERDNHTCKLCGTRDMPYSIAHHILSYNTNPELRYAITNGVTVCASCHSMVHHHFDCVSYFSNLINPSEITRRAPEYGKSGKDMIRSIQRCIEECRNDAPFQAIGK